MFHSFTSSLALAEFCLGEGFALGFNGIATFNRADNVREVVVATPLDQLLLETDAPYLAPPPNRGKRNEPAFVADTARVGAQVFGMDYSEFAAQTEANFARLFWKAAEWRN